jgi:hypothetical protein
MPNRDRVQYLPPHVVELILRAPGLADLDDDQRYAVERVAGEAAADAYHDAYMRGVHTEAARATRDRARDRARAAEEKAGVEGDRDALEDTVKRVCAAFNVDYDADGWGLVLDARIDSALRAARATDSARRLPWDKTTTEADPAAEWATAPMAADTALRVAEAVCAADLQHPYTHPYTREAVQRAVTALGVLRAERGPGAPALDDEDMAEPMSLDQALIVAARTLEGIDRYPHDTACMAAGALRTEHERRARPTEYRAAEQAVVSAAVNAVDALQTAAYEARELTEAERDTTTGALIEAVGALRAVCPF